MNKVLPDTTTKRRNHSSTGQAFVARERELARLGTFLEQAISGRGQVRFVTGGKGGLDREVGRASCPGGPEGGVGPAGCCPEPDL